MAGPRRDRHTKCDTVELIASGQQKTHVCIVDTHLYCEHTFVLWKTSVLWTHLCIVAYCGHQRYRERLATSLYMIVCSYCRLMFCRTVCIQPVSLSVTLRNCLNSKE